MQGDRRALFEKKSEVGSQNSAMEGGESGKEVALQGGRG
jgi:hypothetical protein